MITNKDYIHKTKFNTYQYKRRLPTKLNPYFDVSTLKLSLGDTLQGAQIKAKELNNKINNLLLLQASGSLTRDLAYTLLSTQR